VARVALLGSGAPLNDGSRQPTMLALLGEHGTILVDCGGNPLVGLQRLGIPLEGVERLIVTHSHPDHTAGFPLLLEMLWLSGRRRPLPVHGPADALDLLRRVFGQWDTSSWTGLPDCEWHPIALEPRTLVTTTQDFSLFASPGQHSVNVVGLRVVSQDTGAVLAYSADGRPSAEITELSRGADLLVHEATGLLHGHSTAQQAGEVASSAGARRLVLVHLMPGLNDLSVQQAEAARAFDGPVLLGEDLAVYDF
jgi:ribonuclease Z